MSTFFLIFILLGHPGIHIDSEHDDYFGCVSAASYLRSASADSKGIATIKTSCRPVQRPNRREY